MGARRTSKLTTHMADLGTAGSVSDERACANCETVRHPLEAKGLCRRCYYVHRKLSRADQEIPPEILKGYKNECQRRLDLIRLNEQKREGPISGLDLEHQLCLVAGLAGVPRKKLHIFRGMATFFNENFSPEQKRLIFGLLSNIEENVPWAGLDLGRVVSVSRES